MNAVVYTRVSSDEQIKGMSLAFQRQDCLRYASGKGLAVSKVFEERGESAKFADRPQLIELIQYCKRHQSALDALIVWKLDRLSRNQMDYYFIKRTLSDCGISIHSVTEPTVEDSTSIAGRVYETFVALHAEIDNVIRTERSIRGMEARIESGIYPWQPPLGYACARHQSRGEKKTVPDRPDRTRFPIIQRLFRTCLNEGVCSDTELAILANRWGLSTRAGTKIIRQKVYAIMTNPFYAGLIRNPWTKEQCEGKHRRMITPEEFVRVQQLRAGKVSPARLRRRPEHPDFPLRRTVLCGTCGRSLTGSWSGGRSKKYAYYHCVNHACVMYGKVIAKKHLEHEFCDLLRRIAPRQDRLVIVRPAIDDLSSGKIGDLASARTRHKAHIVELEQRLHSLIAMKERDLLSDEEFVARKKTISDEIKLANWQLSSVTIVNSARPDTTVLGTKFLSDLPKTWLEMVPDLRRRLQQAILPRGVPYVRNVGFGTAHLGLIFALFSELNTPKARLVSHIEQSWDVLRDELDVLMAIYEDYCASCAHER